MLLDSNIIIYLTQPAYADLRKRVSGKKLSTSIVCKIETLGYNKLTAQQQELLVNFFNSIKVIRLTDTIAEQAIKLRQSANISLADAIIAATAISENIELLTHNTEDFKRIDGLRMSDPLANK